MAVGRFDECPNCKRYGFIGGSHRCAPKWEIQVVGEGYSEDGWDTVHGTSAEEAVRFFARQWDSDGEYEIARQDVADFKVRIRPVNAPETAVTYSVRGDFVPHYSISEVA